MGDSATWLKQAIGVFVLYSSSHETFRMGPLKNEAFSERRSQSVSEPYCEWIMMDPYGDGGTHILT